MTFTICNPPSLDFRHFRLCFCENLGGNGRGVGLERENFGGATPTGQPAGGLRPEPVPVSAEGAHQAQRHGTLTIPVAGKYFDQIASGEKLLEYRLVTPFWTQRLVGRSYERVVLTRGYPKAGGVEGETRLTFPWRGYEMQEITHEHFGPLPVQVFAIRVGRP